MECEKCNRRVHCQCYGYDGVYDVRLKEFHFCYNCLFENNSEAYKEALTLVKRRRVLKIILERDEVRQDERSNVCLAEKLSMPKTELNAVFGALQKEKVIYHRKGMEENLWKVTKSARKLRSIRFRYFNPVNNKVSQKRGTRNGTASSFEDEILSDAKPYHDSDTDYSQHDLPHFTRVFASDECIK